MLFPSIRFQLTYNSAILVVYYKYNESKYPSLFVSATRRTTAKTYFLTDFRCNKVNQTLYILQLV